MTDFGYSLSLLAGPSLLVPLITTPNERTTPRVNVEEDVGVLLPKP